METKKEIRRASYLVRRLTIQEGGETRTLPLRYVTGTIKGGEIHELKIEEYDRERAGSIYCDRLTIGVAGTTGRILSM